MTINGTLASMDAVFNTSSARSPPTNIRNWRQERINIKKLRDVHYVLCKLKKNQMMMTTYKLINDIIIKINMTINGTLASMDAVFNTSSARSPPTNSYSWRQHLIQVLIF
jgi:hypothetical protein